MRYHLFICRHAQAQDPAFQQADHERELTEEGKSEAFQAGEWIRQTGHKPDLIVCSSAQRTFHTASIIADRVGFDQDRIVSQKNLYDASETRLLNFLGTMDKSNFHIVIVGHNPGVSNLVATLSGAHRGRIPTGSVHHLWFEMEGWNELEYTPAIGYETNIKYY
ncbi:MAG: histidine phosphatase family protein [Bacteroidota bacterium]|nr:histidine phosphatase family protein [Bacteroidota bacterium]